MPKSIWNQYHNVQALILLFVLFVPQLVFSQGLSELFPTSLQINANSNIAGFDVVGCLEDKHKFEYKFKHDNKDCTCESVVWTVTGGTIDNPSPNTYPFNQKIKVKWDRGLEFGNISFEAINCYVEKNNNGDPIYIQTMERFKSYTVRLLDFDMINLSISPKEADLSWDENIVFFNLVSENRHVKPKDWSNQVIWTVPAAWTIMPVRTLPDGSIEGQGFSSIRVNTNGLFEGQHNVKVEYNQPPCDGEQKKYTREVDISVSGCIPAFTYNAIPQYFQSHSASLTKFNFTQAQNSWYGGEHHQYVSEGAVDVFSEFEFNANSSTTLEFSVAECSGDSPFHTPWNKGNISVSFADNFNKKAINSAGYKMGSNDFDVNARHADQAITIFPNPVISGLEVNGLEMVDQINYTIVSDAGQIFARGTFVKDMESSKYNYFVDVSILPRGFYTLIIKDSYGKINKTLKFIKADL